MTASNPPRENSTCLRVFEDSLDEVAAWCGGEVIDTYGARQIRIITPRGAVMVCVGDNLTRVKDPAGVGPDVFLPTPLTYDRSADSELWEWQDRMEEEWRGMSNRLATALTVARSHIPNTIEHADFAELLSDYWDLVLATADGVLIPFGDRPKESDPS